MINELEFENAYFAMVNFETKEVRRCNKRIIVQNIHKFDDFHVIDDAILEVITKLNSNGYKTRYCCAGHPCFYESAYIYFEPNCIEKVQALFGKAKYWHVTKNDEQRPFTLEIIDRHDKEIDIGTVIPDVIIDTTGLYWSKAIAEFHEICKDLKDDFTYILIPDEHGIIC